MVCESHLSQRKDLVRCFSAANDQLKVWKEKCEKEIEGKPSSEREKENLFQFQLEKKPKTATEEKEKPAAAPAPPAKIKSALVLAHHAFVKLYLFLIDTRSINPTVL
jgi:hypothetical protein